MKSKYLNIKTDYEGITFDSKKELKKYKEYKELEEKGEIKDLKRQVKYILIDKFTLNGKTYRKTTYLADFTFISTKDGKLHVVDVKSPYTRKNPIYRLKKKIMAQKYQIDIEEV
jgi:hypothetical protein